MKWWTLVARISASDLCAAACLWCGLYGLSLLHPAAPWMGASVALGYISIALGKREASRGE